MFWKSFFKLDACVVFNDVHDLSEIIIELKERERYSEGFEIT